METGQSTFFHPPQPQHHQYPPPPTQNGSSPSQNHQQPQSSPIMSQQNPYGGHHPQAAQPTHQMPYNPGTQPYPMNYALSHTAALANATAAATTAPWGHMQVAPPGQDVKGRRSPAHMPRRLSHHAQPAPVMQAPQLPRAGAPSDVPEDTPLYVNAKQFHRILKRRNARQKLEEALRLTSKTRKPYLHESRHKHAMRRPRGPGGRFLTSDEVAAMDKKALEEGGHLSDDNASTGAKRKAPNSYPGNNKKSKHENHPVQDLHSAD